MTSQTKQFIEISDIVGVEFRCKHCDVSVVVGQKALPTAVDTYSEMLHECPTCKRGWTVTKQNYPLQTGFDTQVKKFLRMLAEIAQLQEHLGCELRLEISAEDPKPSTAQTSKQGQ
jgi:hypothetical protein